MLPGKTYAPEDFVAIAMRRKWAIILPFVIIAIGTVVVAHYLPNRYRSETVILVVPQQISESYVRAALTTTSRIEDRLQAIAQQILSRTFLERIIVDFDLYPQARKTAVMENIVENMRRKDISIEPIKGDAFKVSYISGDPQIAMKVTERLAALFIEENRRDREILADGTVKGGTGWGSEFAKLCNKRLFVFDQTRDQWFRWTGQEWEKEAEPRITRNHFTGTGTRLLKDNGLKAINDLFDRSFG